MGPFDANYPNASKFCDAVIGRRCAGTLRLTTNENGTANSFSQRPLRRWCFPAKYCGLHVETFLKSEDAQYDDEDAANR